MADLRKLKDRAAELLARGRFSKAAEALAQVVQADPRDIASRQKLADALRKSGSGDDAVRVYEDVADRYARDGQLIKAIAICKIILEVDSEHSSTQQLLADLYARKQEKGGAARPLRGGPTPERAAAPEPEPEEPNVELPLAPAGGAREIEFPDEPGLGAGAATPATEVAQAAEVAELVISVEQEAEGSGGPEEVVVAVEPEGFRRPARPPPPPFELILGAARAEGRRCRGEARASPADAAPAPRRGAPPERGRRSWRGDGYRSRRRSRRPRRSGGRRPRSHRRPSRRPRSCRGFRSSPTSRARPS
jgi:hypothetical protein